VKLELRSIHPASGSVGFWTEVDFKVNICVSSGKGWMGFGAKPKSPTKYIPEWYFCQYRQALKRMSPQKKPDGIKPLGFLRTLSASARCAISMRNIQLWVSALVSMTMAFHKAPAIASPHGRSATLPRNRRESGKG